MLMIILHKVVDIQVNKSKLYSAPLNIRKFQHNLLKNTAVIACFPLLSTKPFTIYKCNILKMLSTAYHRIPVVTPFRCIRTKIYIHIYIMVSIM